MFTARQRKNHLSGTNGLIVFSSLVLGNRLVLTELVIKWMQDLGDDTVTAEETSLKYRCELSAQTVPHGPCLNALCTRKGHGRNAEHVDLFGCCIPMAYL